MIKRIASELKEHIPFTALGAVTGIAIMLIIIFAAVPTQISQAAFTLYTRSMLY